MYEPVDRSGAADEVRAATEEDDLAVGLKGLAALSSIDLRLEELLVRVARYAVRAIPGADGAGLTLLEQDRPNTIVATAEFVSEIDDVQYGLGQGPCITAAREAVTVVSGSLGGDARWRQFGGRVARMGVHSALSLPLMIAERVVGAMNVYAYEKDVFDDRAAELGEIFAVPAAVAVQNAQALAEARRLATRLQAALDSRVVVERAVGIVMSRSGVSGAEALQRLRVLSQHQHEKLPVIAQTIVEEAVRTARARHSP